MAKYIVPKLFAIIFNQKPFLSSLVPFVTQYFKLVYYTTESITLGATAAAGVVKK